MNTAEQHNPVLFPETERVTLINYVANSERKLIIGALLGTESEQSLTRREIVKRTSDLQGSSPTWELGDADVRDYMQRSFRPAEIIEESADGRTYRIKEDWRTKVLAFCGTYIDWSLAYPDTSLIPLLGRTGSSAERQSPETRLRIYRRLGTDGLTREEIQSDPELRHIGTGSFKAQLNRLHDMGFIAVKSREIGYNPQLIIHPTTDQSAPAKTPATKLLYRGLQHAYESAATTQPQITLDELLETCQTLDPTFDLSLVRRNFTIHANDSPRWTLVHESEYDPKKRVTISIHPDYAEPIGNLCVRFKELVNSDVCDYYAEVARSRLNDPQAMHFLMAKAMRFAMHGAKARDNEPAIGQVRAAVEALGTATAGQLIEYIRQNGKTPPHRLSLMKLLNQLVETGEFKAEKRSLNQSSKRQIIHFSPSKEQADTQGKAEA